MDTTAKRLSDEMKAHKVTTADLAKMTGLSVSTINRCRTGKIPSDEQAEKISAALGCPVKYLMCIEEDTGKKFMRGDMAYSIIELMIGKNDSVHVYKAMQTAREALERYDLNQWHHKPGDLPDPETIVDCVLTDGSAEYCECLLFEDPYTRIWVDKNGQGVTVKRWRYRQE